MTKPGFLIVFIVISLSSSILYLPQEPKEKIQITFSKNKRSLDSCFTDLLTKASAITTKDSSTLYQYKRAFFRCRLKFKEMEFLAEYFAPYLKINKPFMPEIDEIDAEVERPQGFGVLENIIYTRNVYESLKQLKQETYLLQVNAQALYPVNNRLKSADDSQLFEAMRAEINRIITLGITGYDTPESKICITESAVALQAVRDAVSQYYPKVKTKLKAKLEEKFKASISYLISNPDFDSFDRLKFITDYANPLTTYLLIVQQSLSIPVCVSKSNMVNYNAPTIFDKIAFSRYYNIKLGKGEDYKAKIELGKLLFFDPILSGNKKRACSSCHNPDKTFTDGLERSTAFNFEGALERNAPSLVNTSLQPLFFHDGRARSLEEQVGLVIENKKELGGDFKEIVTVLNTSKAYKELFKKAFGDSDSLITADKIKKSIAGFERSLVSFNSPFDQYVAGNKTKLNTEQIKGFNLFMGKAQCATCHFPPLFNGLLPPEYKKIEIEVLGITADNDFKEPKLDADKGRLIVTGISIQSRAFKTSSIRNVELTAPYMHNGSLKNLDEVMEFYNKGGGQGLGLDVPNQTLSSKNLNLSPGEVKDVIAFMKSLSDAKKYIKKPAHLPEIMGIERKAGGEY